jgi:hypothetical protein
VDKAVGCVFERMNKKEWKDKKGVGVVVGGEEVGGGGW